MGASRKVLIVEGGEGGYSEKVSADNAIFVGGDATEGNTPVVQPDGTVEWEDPSADSSKWEADGATSIKPTDSKKVSMDNMVEGADAKVLTAAERTSISANASTLSGHITTHPAPTERDDRNDPAGAGTAASQVLAVDQLTHGFTDESETTYAFDDTTFEYTLTDAGSGWSYYRDGPKHTITGNKSIRLTESGTPAADTYYLYSDATDGTLSSGTPLWTLEDSKVPVAIVTFNDALTPKYLIQDERHTTRFNKVQHHRAHETFGTLFGFGGLMANYQVEQTTPVDAHNTYSVTTCRIWDEDRMINTDALPVGGPYHIHYRTAAAAWSWVQQAYPFRYTTAGYIQWDNNGTMTQGSANNFYCTYHLATNIDGVASNLVIHGQAEHASIGAAESERFERDLVFTGFDVAEGVALYKIIWEAKAAYNTAGKVRMKKEPERIEIGIGGVGAPVTTVASGDVSLDSALYAQNLSTADDDVQKAFDTLNAAPITQDNILINTNGKAMINQRGASVVAQGAYSFDRWRVDTSDVTTLTVSEETTGARFTATTKGAGAFFSLAQYIENPVNWRGKTITLSARMRQTGASSNNVLRIFDGAFTNVAVPNDGEFHTVSVTATVGAAATTLRARIDIVIGADGDYVEFEWIKLEEGTKATPWRIPDPAIANHRCDRYTQAGSTRSINGTLWVPFRNRLRATPTVTPSAGSAGNITVDGFELTHNAAAAVTFLVAAEI